MPSLVDVATVRSAVQTDIGDSVLQIMIDAAELEIVQAWGPNWAADVATVTKERLDYSLQNVSWIYLQRRILSITSITEYYGDELNELTRVLAPSDYRIMYGGYALQRIGGGLNPDWLFGHRVVIVYTPQDDTPKRKQAIIELVRLGVRHSGVKGQAVGDASETSFDDYTAERQMIINALGPAMEFS